MNAKGPVFKYGDNIDTDVIIPARYLNTQSPAELAAHCMEDIDNTFITRVTAGDILVGGGIVGHVLCAVFLSLGHLLVSAHSGMRGRQPGHLRGRCGEHQL